jgi:hypothetical protein
MKSSLKADRHFEGLCRLYLQGRISQERNHHEVGNKQCLQTHAGFLISLFLNPADGTTFCSETSVGFQLTTRRFVP